MADYYEKKKKKIWSRLRMQWLIEKRVEKKSRKLKNKKKFCFNIIFQLWARNVRI